MSGLKSKCFTRGKEIDNEANLKIELKQMYQPIEFTNKIQRYLYRETEVLTEDEKYDNETCSLE